jgi:AcrR family transcriptional regulator
MAKRSESDLIEKPKKRAGRTRKEQQRAIETRQAILDAALNEFAERGFEGASIRRIGDRAGIDYTLITYHYKNKLTLWQAVAEDSFLKIEKMWDAVASGVDMSGLDRLKVEYRAFMEFTIEHSAFHRFMLSENYIGSPRLAWLIENFLARSQHRLLQHIKDAQAQGQLVDESPILVHYMILGMVSVLASLNGEMNAIFGLSLDDRSAVDTYWNLIERVVFDKARTAAKA